MLSYWGQEGTNTININHIFYPNSETVKRQTENKRSSYKNMNIIDEVWAGGHT